MLASPLSKIARTFAGLLSCFDDSEIDDALLRHQVQAQHSAQAAQIVSTLMGALVTLGALALTGERIFLVCGLGHVIAGLGRINCIAQYRNAAKDSDRRETTLAFDRHFTDWSTLHALLIGLTCFALEAIQSEVDTFPLAVGCSAGFTAAYAGCSSGRMGMLLRQVLATSLPAAIGMATLPIAYGGFYAFMLSALAVTSLVLGHSGNLKVIQLYRADQMNFSIARVDMLTGLMNRLAFTETLSRALSSWYERPTGRFALVTVDLDRFKHVNETLGHSAGDEVLVEAAARLSELMRPGDMLARLNGDEFAILAHGEPTDARAAAALAGRVVAALSRPFCVGSTSLPGSASVGVAIFPDHGARLDDLMKHVDVALGEAKRGGGGYEIFDLALQTRVDNAALLEVELEKAIAEDQFEPWFQPIQNIETGGIIGYEALARWRHPTHGLIEPSRFIPAAEQSGAIVAIGQAILEKACAAAAFWDPRLTFAVNLSPGQFREPEQLVETIKQALMHSQLDPSRLFVEITEFAAVWKTRRRRAPPFNSSPTTACAFSLDDFGVGYSSLAYLHSYPFSKIKIDRKFIDRIDSDHVATAIIAAVCLLADRICMDIVAEGVETRVQQAALRRLGIKLAQGYLFGRPAPDVEPAPLLRLISSR